MCPSQWRIRNIVASTTAFTDISLQLASFQHLNIRDFSNISGKVQTLCLLIDIILLDLESARLSFLLNLYNLMSLHAAVLMPWPTFSNTTNRVNLDNEHRFDRVNWLKCVNYRLGSQNISLLQLEFCLLRSRSKILDLPSIPGVPEVGFSHANCVIVLTRLTRYLCQSKMTSKL